MAVGDVSYAEVVGTLLTGALATLYTVPANRVVTGVDINLVNVDTSSTYYPEIQAIPVGQSAGDRYKQRFPQSAGGNGMVAGEGRSFSRNPMWAAGTFIQARESGGVASKIAFSMGIILEEV